VRANFFCCDLLCCLLNLAHYKHSLLIPVMRSIIQRFPDRRGEQVFRIFFLFFALFLTPQMAWADPQVGWAAPDDDSGDDSDDLDLESETPEEKKAREEAEKSRLQEDDSLDLLDDEDELEKVEDEEPTDENAKDLLEGEIGKDVIGGEGEDNSTIFREAQTKFGRMIPDEEMIAWEGYLETYPNSLYKARIEKRTDELEKVLYEQLIETKEPERLDADKREILFAQGINMETLNPRTRAQFAFEWGLPDYMNLVGDYEYQVLRELSLHGGFRRRYTGWNFETGLRWAFIKSSRTKTLLVLITDFHFNMDPFFVGIRPQLGFGKKVGKLDLQAQLGVDLELRKHASPRLLGGVNATYHAADQVSLFVETTIHMRNFGATDFETFRFNLMTFGMKFYPDFQNMEKRSLEINVGANVPYTSAYWMFHFGAISAQVNYYL